LFCLTDNDVILKLAACDLLEDALIALQVTKDNVYISSTTRFSVVSQARKLGPNVTTRVTNFLNGIKTIDWDIPSEEVSLFEDAIDIDVGEAILFAATAAVSQFRLITSDKRSLRALTQSEEFANIVNRLKGRVVCLEQLIQQCINHHGFDSVKNRIVPARECDTALKAIFGSGLQASEGGVKEGLESYIYNLRSSVGDLLVI
jgi:hypothetical protein